MEVLENSKQGNITIKLHGFYNGEGEYIMCNR